MFARILSLRPVIGKINLASSVRTSIGAQKTARTQIRLNSTQTSNVFQQTEAKVKGFWGLIERYHTRRLINMSTPLTGSGFLELDIKRGPDIKILTDNIKGMMFGNNFIAAVFSIGTFCSFFHCCDQHTDWYPALSMYVSYNWPIWLIIYYNEMRAFQSRRLLNSINKTV